jgi:hypothetical protein
MLPGIGLSSRWSAATLAIYAEHYPALGLGWDADQRRE